MSRPFFIKSYFECPSWPEVAERIPPHKLVIEPLVAAALEIRVYQKEGYEFEVPLPPHTVQQSTRVLDLTAEIVRGWEKFWNSGMWRRGAVAVKCNSARIDWNELFIWTEYGGVWSSRHQIQKGTPSGAVTYCDKHAVGETVVFCLSASNGIQWIDVWSDPSQAQQLDQLAQSTCRHFVRSIEQGKYPREIIYNDGSYRNNV
jgi:hypothetical protein